MSIHDEFDRAMNPMPWEGNTAKKSHAHPSANIYNGVTVPESTTVGAFADIGSQLGRFSKVQCHVSIPPGWTLGDGVFYGPGCRFANDKNPAIGETFEPQGGTVGNGAVIGMGALIGAGVNIGKYAVIGMGAVVLNDVPPGEVWVGNPARFLRAR